MMGRWAGVLVLSMLAGRAAQAQVQTCLVASSGVSFGTYDPFASSASLITGTVSVTCQATVSVGLTYSIQIGAGGGGGYNTRALAAGAGRLSYQLYTNMTRVTVWGDGTGGTGVVSDGYTLLALTNTMRSYTIYGTIPARQTVPPGSYSDTATVLLVY